MKKTFGLLLYLSLFVIQISNGQQNTPSLWNYVNPLPFTYDIHSASFVSDSIGWVTGKDGTINKTTDAGKTWSYQVHKKQADLHDLRSIYFFNDSIGWAVGYYGNMVKTTDGGENWNVMNSGTEQLLYSVNFVSRDTGFVLGGNGINLKTTNGGTTWIKLPSTKAEIFSSKFINYKLGYATGYGYYNNRMKSVVLKTTDAGQTWNTSILDSIGKFSCCYFRDSIHGWIVGDAGKVFKTSDGGSIWQKVKIDSSKYFTAISFKNDLIGCISTMDDSLIYNTTDGGNSWHGISVNTAASLTNIVFTKNMVYTSGLGGFIFVSSDDGKSWSSLSNYVTHSNLVSASFVGNTNGWAVGSEGTIIKTDDEGKTWKLQQSNTLNGLNSVFFIDSLNGLTCGYESTILRTSDGGEHWSGISLDSSSLRLFSLYFSTREIGYCSGADKNYNSTMLKTTDGGLSWRNITSPVSLFGIPSLVFLDSLNGWACGYDIFHTTDGGESWVAKKTLLNNSLSQIVFSDSLHGWAMGYFEFLRTTDGGKTWNKIILKEHVSYSLFFKNAYEGWRVGAYGYIYHSTDAGYSWKTVSRSNPQLNFVTSNGNKVFAFGEYGAILTTSLDVVSAIEEKEEYLKIIGYNLTQNYPNPFNPSTTIQYSLKESGNVDLSVYNTLGQKVLSLVNEHQNVGSHLVKFDASQLASGIYIYRIKANGFSASKKLLLLK